MQDGCVFCKFIAGQFGCHKIFEDNYTLAFLDINPDCEGHTLVIPKEHYCNLLECPSEIVLRVLNTVQKVAAHYMNLGYKGFNVVQNNGQEAGQVVNHLHFHILPRKNKEDYKKAYSKPTDDEIKDICKKLKVNK